MRCHIRGKLGSGETIEFDAELPEHTAPGMVVQIGDERLEVREMHQEVGVAFATLIVRPVPDPPAFTSSLKRN